MLSHLYPSKVGCIARVTGANPPFQLVQAELPLFKLRVLRGWEKGLLPCYMARRADMDR